MIGDSLPFEAIFALSSKKRHFLFPLAGVGANHFHRAYFWKLCAFSERLLIKELPNPALPGCRRRCYGQRGEGNIFCVTLWL